MSPPDWAISNAVELLVYEKDELTIAALHRVFRSTSQRTFVCMVLWNISSLNHCISAVDGNHSVIQEREQVLACISVVTKSVRHEIRKHESNPRLKSMTAERSTLKMCLVTGVIGIITIIVGSLGLGGIWDVFLRSIGGLLVVAGFALFVSTGSVGYKASLTELRHQCEYRKFIKESPQNMV